MQQRAEKRLRDFRETVLNWKQTGFIIFLTK